MPTRIGIGAGKDGVKEQGGAIQGETQHVLGSEIVGRSWLCLENCKKFGVLEKRTYVTKHE